MATFLALKGNSDGTQVGLVSWSIRAESSRYKSSSFPTRFFGTIVDDDGGELTLADALSTFPSLTTAT